MDVPEKKTLSAKEILRDIKDGMTDVELMEKYHLGPKTLQSLFEKLVDAGAIQQSDLDLRNSNPQETAEEGNFAEESSSGFTCPACKMPQSKQFDVCPQCGVIVEKFLASKEKKKACIRQEIRDDLGKRSASLKGSYVRRRSIIVGLSILFVVVISSAMIVYHSNKRPRNPDDGPQGSPKKVELENLNSDSKRRPEPEKSSMVIDGHLYYKLPSGHWATTKPMFSREADALMRDEIDRFTRGETSGMGHGTQQRPQRKSPPVTGYIEPQRQGRCWMVCIAKRFDYNRGQYVWCCQNPYPHYWQFPKPRCYQFETKGEAIRFMQERCRHRCGD